MRQHTWSSDHGAFGTAQCGLGETFGISALLMGWAEALGHWFFVARPAESPKMEAFLVSAGVVALGEIGDKTQLLALMLAARYRRPVPIILGIFVATLVNHTIAGAVGAWVTTVISKDVLRWILGLSFLVMAGWVLVPDKLDDKDTKTSRWDVFGTTVLTFFLAEMGDKTQLATVALAAKYVSMVPVIAGTTLGMLIADVPVVFLGDKAATKIPLKLVHGVAAAIFALLGILVLFNVGNTL
jgi:putative Ca2+/H+ antiporter (TMEM165/GDT1 family)